MALENWEVSSQCETLESVPARVSKDASLTAAIAIDSQSAARSSPAVAQRLRQGRRPVAWYGRTRADEVGVFDNRCRRLLFEVRSLRCENQACTSGGQV